MNRFSAIRELRVFVLVPAACAFAALTPAISSAQTPWRFDEVDRFVAVSDIHGAYDAFETILRKADIIDEQLAWTGGADHLVVVGDVLDRGPDSRRALDLIMRLHGEAERAGGAVHLVLGNHELMNLVGDLRYVSDGEYAAFAADETAEIRTAGIDSLRIPDGVDPEAAREQLDAQIPPGFFAHRAAFGPEGRYGAWLLQQPVLVAVNDWAFVHGGLAEASGDFSAAELNRTLIEQLHSYMVALEALIDGGVLTPTDAFYDHPALLAEFGEELSDGGREWPAGMDVAANIVADLSRAFVFEPDSPTWYRGNIGCSRLIESDRLTATLQQLGVAHLVVGHTPSRDAQVHKRFEDQLFRIDTGMLNAYYGGRAAALIVEGAGVSVIYEDSDMPSPVTIQAREVGRRPSGMTREALATFLEEAEITSVVELDERWQAVTLKDGELALNALFSPHDSKNRKPDIAAYRLDVALGLDMVPVTVERSVNGKAGALQYAPPGVVTESERQESRGGGSAWCPLNDQFDAMYVFDALIGNTGRTLERMHYSADNYQLLLVGHDVSFPNTGEKPAYLREVPLRLSPAWIEQLRSLSETGLEEDFGDVLDRRQRRALLERRDAILAGAGLAR